MAVNRVFPITIVTKVTTREASHLLILAYINTSMIVFKKILPVMFPHTSSVLLATVCLPRTTIENKEI